MNTKHFILRVRGMDMSVYARALGIGAFETHFCFTIERALRDIAFNQEHNPEVQLFLHFPHPTSPLVYRVETNQLIPVDVQQLCFENACVA